MTHITHTALAIVSPLETTRLRIRRFRPEDVDPFVAFMTDPESTMFLPFPDAMKTRDGAVLLIEDTIRRYPTGTPHLAYALEHRDAAPFVGFCGMTVQADDAVEILYAILPPFRCRGFGRETVRALCAHIFAATTAKRVTAYVLPSNGPSLAVVRKLGFQETGPVAHALYRDPVQQFSLDRETLEG